jgi:succinoglycan biosynthesis transport protein ExoP
MGPSPGPTGGGFNTIDPIRLLKKYRVWMVLVLMLGAIAGTASHFVLKETRPVYRASVLFRVYPPRTDVTETMQTGSEEELSIFMATEAQIMVSAEVLRRAMEDPRLPRLAPTWTEAFSSGGRYSPVDAAIELEKRIGARVVSGTAFIRMTMGYSDAAEVAAIVGTVRSAYLADLARRGAALTANETSALDLAIKESNEEIGELQRTRNSLAIEHSLDALDVRVSTVRSNLDMRAAELVAIQRQMMDAGTRLREMELQLQRPGGIEYADSMRQEVQLSGMIQGLQGQIVSLETSRLASRERLGPDHRELRTIENHLQALNQKVEQEMQRLLRDRFEGTITVYREFMQSLRAQEADLLTQMEALTSKLNELVVVQNNLRDIETKIILATQLLAEYQVRRKSIQTTVRLDVSDRVILAEGERVPERLAFPKLFVMIPAGVFVLGGLFAAGVVLFETVDQRVKSPADVASLPMARVLGVIPHASEDPAAVKALETVYRDHPSGVMAECYRQTRALALKQMRQVGARSLAIIPAMPGSGGSTVAANLAQALAAADLKVLLIDANFRRPRQHAIFGLDEAPGLAEALAGESLGQAARPSGYDGLDILTAGGADPRRQERLATDTMARLIATASESYDYVVVDVAPIVVSGDAINMANKVDATLLVTRAYSEKRGMIARVLRDLSEQPAETLGVIVNGVRAATGGYLRRNILATHKYQNTSRKA